MKEFQYYKKKPLIIKAAQWFQNGDHPDDACYEIPDGQSSFLSEGKVVRYYRTPKIDGKGSCKHCGDIMHVHGWIETLEGGHIVCPGDFIVTGIKGETYPVKAQIFQESYELIEADHTS